MRCKKLTKLFKPFLLSVFFLPIVTLASFEFAYRNKIYPGVNINQIPVGNQTKKATEQKIKTDIAQKNLSRLIFLWNNQSWQIELKQLNFAYQIPKTIRKAYNFGRDQGLIANIQNCVQIWRKPKNFPLDYFLNQSQLEKEIAAFSSQLFVPAVPPSLKYSSQNNEVYIEMGTDGQELELQALLEQIDFQLNHAINKPISLPIKKTAFNVHQQNLQKTKNRAELFLDKKLILQIADQSYEIKKEEFFPFLSFDGRFNEKTIQDYVSQLANLVNQTPQNALFKFESGKATVFRPSKSGITLDQKQAHQLIKQALENLEQLSKNEKTISLLIELTEPKIKIGDINRFGIIEKIGEGKSTFRGSIASRIHNIQLASTRLSGILIPPGEIFSFNQSLGEVAQTTGFQQAYIIKQGRTVLGDGGGVCQVSTTLFRAILQAGLPILERHAHAYRVSYYEQDSQPGFDATVFDPTADFKSQNDTPAYILIQAVFDNSNKSLVFEIYGTSDNRLITISKARVWDQAAPPPDLYQDDPTLPVGTIKQVDWKAWGAKVAFDWKVTRNSEVLQERTFSSQYQPWQAIYLRGVGQ